jgi:hypothetical protein
MKIQERATVFLRKYDSRSDIISNLKQLTCYFICDAISAKEKKGKGIILKESAIKIKININETLRIIGCADFIHRSVF